MASVLHYRPWRGSLRAPYWAVWPIARVSLWMIFRRKLFWVLYGLGLMIFLLFFFGQYLLAWAETQLGETSVNVLGLREKPSKIVSVLADELRLNGSNFTYVNLIWYQGYITMVILALAGSILIGNDLRYGSLPFYLSKPISTWHYLLGKGLAVGVFINLMTTVPAVVLFVQYGLLRSWNYYYDSGRLFFGILGYGFVLTLTLTSLLLATATWLRRTVPMIMVWTTVFILCRVLATSLVEGLNWDAQWRLLDLWNDMYVVGCHLLQIPVDKIRPAPQPDWRWAAGVLLGVCVVCMSYLILRIRAVEVVK